MYRLTEIQVARDFPTVCLECRPKHKGTGWEAELYGYKAKGESKAMAVLLVFAAALNALPPECAGRVTRTNQEK